MRKNAHQSRVRGERYPVEFVASEFGFERKTLQRWLEDAGIHPNGAGITLREAVQAVTARTSQKADLLRRQKAEADTAEIEAAERRGKLMLTEEHIRQVKEFGTEIRAKVMQANHISPESKKKLLGAFAEIET